MADRPLAFVCSPLRGEANRIGHELAARFTKGRYAFIVCTHTDKSHIHKRR